MSFTTRCPACGTVFRVVADQLKISDGWVRCGHCSDVFDATIHLQAWVPAAKSPGPDREPAAPTTPAGAVPAPAPEATPGPSPVSTPLPTDSPPQDVPDDDDLRAWFGDGPLDPPSAGQSPAQLVPDETPSALPRSSAAQTLQEAAGASEPETLHEADPAQASSAQEAAASAEPVPAPDFQAELERFAQTVRASTPVAALPATAREDRASETQPTPVAQPPAEDVAQDASADAAMPGFIRQARRRAFWSSAGVRAALGVVALLLGALLAAQWAVQQRHQLVATYPQARPWMAQVCGWLGCDLAPLRRIEAVEIESAELVRRLGNFYSFDFVLRNRSSLEVATPALELTLTGLGTQPIARRVFLPQDWPDAPAALPPGGTVSVSLRLALMLGDDAPTAGYRALAFYP
ncbi:DUF3426 domain-containing protein [Hydrogenophaga intermedia]|uniref:DUF3426 domain-containing protein n=1 Tax=Hydrogenophaga intermedia TaxID=65786 RepID=UPI0020446E55|nr:DUF3426 domain-containing protein [Hydrogenophaga intermedia]MCM3562548.1 zinc-ribbon domain-containing protein [Hydrogenophaga intermedia]